MRGTQEAKTPELTPERAAKASFCFGFSGAMSGPPMGGSVLGSDEESPLSSGISRKLLVSHTPVTATEMVRITH